MIRRPPRSTLSSSSAASDVYKRQVKGLQNISGRIKITDKIIATTVGNVFMYFRCFLLFVLNFPCFFQGAFGVAIHYERSLQHVFVIFEFHSCPFLGQFNNRTCLLYTSDAADEEDSV